MIARHERAAVWTVVRFYCQVAISLEQAQQIVIPHFSELEHWRSRLAFQIVARAGAAQPFFIIDNHPPAQEDFLRIAGQHPAFIKVIVGAVLGMRYPIFKPSFGVPDDDVSIGAGQQAAFLRVKSEDFGRVGAI